MTDTDRDDNPSNTPPATSRSLPIALLRAREAVMVNFRPMLTNHDVTEQQWRVLRVLSESGPLDASDLAARASILAPSLTRILKTLEERSLVTRARDGNDGRRSWIAIAPQGAMFIGKVAPESRAIYAALERRFGRERVDLLLDLLRDLTEVARRD